MRIQELDLNRDRSHLLVQPRNSLTTIRGGYTLIELMVVLAIVAGVYALSWPALMRPMARNHVQVAGQQLADQLRQARTRAIETSSVFQFRYQLGNNRYEVKPLHPTVSTTSDAVQIGSSSRSIGSVAAYPVRSNQNTLTNEPPLQPNSGETNYLVAISDRNITVSETLPIGIRFVDPDQPDLASTAVSIAPAAESLHAPTTATIDPLSAVSPEPLAGDNLARWSDPVFFFPNGQSDACEIELGDEKQFVATVVVESWTGNVRVTTKRRPEPNAMGQLVETPAP